MYAVQGSPLPMRLILLAATLCGCERQPQSGWGHIRPRPEPVLLQPLTIVCSKFTHVY